MKLATVGEVDDEVIKRYREVACYIGVEAGVKATVFASVRAKMAGAGEHGDIPTEQKDRLMKNLGEPATKWKVFEAEYRHQFYKNKPSHAAYVGNTNRGERTVVRVEHMIHRGNAQHTLRASTGLAKDMNNLIGSAVAITKAGLKNDTAGATRRRKFNSPESEKFVKGVLIKVTNGRKARFNGERATREQEH